MHRIAEKRPAAISTLVGTWLIFGLMPAGAVAAEPDGQATYEGEVRPLLQKLCADCHSRGTSEDRWAFDGYAKYADLVADQKQWGKAAQLVAGHLMPPHGEAAPTAAQRRAILDWIENSVFYVDPIRPDPGRTILRRLNRAEYNNTIRDVFGVQCRPADQFPADDTGYGFDTIGDVLTISPLQLEKYLAAAREVAEEATRLAPPSRVGVELAADKLTVFAGRPDRSENVLVLRTSEDEAGTTIHIPATSMYRVLTRAAVAREGEQAAARLEVLCDGQPLAELAPSAAWKGKPGGLATVFTLVEIPAGEHRIAVRAKRGAGAANEPQTLAALGFLGISGPFTLMPPVPSEYLRQQASSRPLGVPILRLSGEDLDAGSGRSSLDTGRAWFSANGYRHAPVLIRQTGKYRIRFKVGAQQVGQEHAQFEVRLAERKLGPLTVTARAQAEQWVEAQWDLPAGEHDWQVWFVNEFKDPQSGAERWFWLHEFTIEGPLEGQYGLAREDIDKLIAATGRGLFRRALTTEESHKLTRLVDSARSAGRTPSAALQVALEALLVSPRFLFHPLPRPCGDEKDGTATIDELTLASRLSYFLWSSAPDEELLALAERGQLRAALAAQVRRMIRDPKSEALTANFAGQWLQLRDLEHVRPDAAAFPEFDADLAADMRRETEMLFEHILKNNQPVSAFLDADYTFANARLAKHYGLPAPSTEGFQRVALADSPRRGVLTHASVLTLTSHPTRTSPVKRGKWLLEQMLGIEPPPPPREVPPLPEANEAQDATLRQRLEEHRDNPACASCHALLDPPGFALENYDAIGRWRSTDAGQKVDASISLVTGEAFADWSELRAWLVRERQEAFARCLTKHLLTYALGRGVTYHDKTAIAQILERAKPSRYGFEDLIVAVCESVPMQRMRTQQP